MPKTSRAKDSRTARDSSSAKDSRERLDASNSKSTHKMAMVISLSTIITQKLHRVIFDNVLGMLLHESLRTIPQRWNGFHILIQAQHEAVLFLVVGHILEGIEANVAEEFDAWLHAPVPFELIHEGMPEEEPRFISAHVSIAHRVAIDDLSLRHISANLGCLVLIDKFGEFPMLVRNQAIVRFPGYQSCGQLLECLIERLVVEENPVIVVLSIEAILDMTNRFGNVPHIGIPSQRHERSIHFLGCSMSRR